MVFAHDDYKSFISAACTEAGIPFARVAEAAGMHRQYLTQVLKKKGHLSDEQAHRVGVFLGLADEALAYFLLLVQEAKSAHPATRRYFATRRAELRAAKESLSANLAAETTIVAPRAPEAEAEFFLDVDLQICHAHLFIPAFQKDPRLLLAKLRLEPAALDALLARLVALGLVESVGGQLRSRQPFLHLDKDSPISKQNHRNWRVYAAHVPLGRRPGELFFSSTVTSDRKARKRLIDALKAVIADFHQGLAATADEEAFQVNVDVFGL
jgi:hypothetical protein